jgi:4-hydroxy-tetrahydrodipicolinate reductase
MGHAAAEAIVRAGLPLVPYTLTGYSAGVAVGGVGVAGIPVEVVGKASRQEALDRVKEQYGGGAGGNNSTSGGRLIVVDYTTPAAALDNALFYARNGVPFVMGTTGADAEQVARAAQEAGVPALVAPQMGKQVVALQAALQMAADAFPGAFSGYELDVVESHQASKVDVSGTAREVVRSLRGLGGRFAAEAKEEKDEVAAEGGGGEAAATTSSSNSSSDPVWHVRRVRDRATQQSPAIGVPYDALGGHAYHTYTLSSPGAPPLPPLLAASSGSGGSGASSSSSVRKAKAAAAAAAPAPDSAPESDENPDAGSWSRFVFKHNVVGREVYARGTADAVLFLAAAARAAARRQAKGGGGGASSSGTGRVFDMVDVLRAGDLRARAARARALAARDEKQQQPVSSSSSSSARRANSPSVAAAAAASAAATRTAKEERAKAKAAAGESDA